MSTRKFDFALNGVSVLVEAEQDGRINGEPPF